MLFRSYKKRSILLPDTVPVLIFNHSGHVTVSPSEVVFRFFVINISNFLNIPRANFFSVMMSIHVSIVHTHHNAVCQPQKSKAVLDFSSMFLSAHRAVSAVLVQSRVIFSPMFLFYVHWFVCGFCFSRLSRLFALMKIFLCFSSM